MNVLVLNAGSSSVKYALIDLAGRVVVTQGKIERIGEALSHEQAFAAILDRLSGHTVDAVGHRVVHGGPRFHEATRIDDEVLAAIEACVPLAPLHNPANLLGIAAVARLTPQLPQYVSFDTAFHATNPEVAVT